MKLVSIFLLLAVVLSGCGIVTKQQSEDVYITSDPPGATVIVNQQEMGLTPITVKVKSTKDSTLEVINNGKTKIIQCTVSPGVGYIIIDCILGFFPAIIDFATGGWNSIDNPKIHVKF